MQGSWIDLPDDNPFYLAPLGDIQWNGHEEDIALDDLKRHIDMAMEKHAWFIGMGDYIDMASPTGRQKVDAAGHYDNLLQTIDDRALELTYQVGEILKPTTGRWAGFLSGHHYWKDQHGITSDQRLCEMLNAPYLGDDLGEMGGGAIYLLVPTHRGNRSIQIWAHHGAGSGEESSLLLKLKKIAGDWEELHLFLYGHMTKMASTVIPKLRFSFHRREKGPFTFKVIERRVPLVGTGGWAKAYVPGKSTYVERKPATMRPVSLGAPLIHVIPEFRRSHAGGEDVLRWAPKLEVMLW